MNNLKNQWFAALCLALGFLLLLSVEAFADGQNQQITVDDSFKQVQGASWADPSDMQVSDYETLPASFGLSLHTFGQLHVSICDFGNPTQVVLTSYGATNCEESYCPAVAESGICSAMTIKESEPPGGIPAPNTPMRKVVYAWFNMLLPVCSGAGATDCIDGVVAQQNENTAFTLSPVTERVQQCNFDYLSCDFKGDYGAGIPSSVSGGAIFEFPSAANSPFMVSLRVGGPVYLDKGIPRFSSGNGSIFGLYLNAVKKLTSSPCAPNATCTLAGWHDFLKYCKQSIAAIDNVCYSEYETPKDIRFSVALRLSKNLQLGGWLTGNFKGAQVTQTDAGSSNLLTISALPAEVPEYESPLRSCTLALNNCQSVLGTGNLGESVRGDIGWRTPYFSVPDAMRLVANDKNTSIRNLWEAIWYPTDLCGRQGSDYFWGISETNATFSSSKPGYDAVNHEITFSAAGMHYLPDGSVSQGFYGFVIREDAAQCMFGVQKLPSKIKLEISSNDGTEIHTTASLAERDGWYYFRADGFTYSQKNFRVSLAPDPLPTQVATTNASSPEPTQSTPTTTPSPTFQPPTLGDLGAGPVAIKQTITCTKGKLIKRVSGKNPKCPAGYKKKA